MGTTLQNGVYLPNEGERNCYAGLKTNWEILDQKVADVTALQQAVAGALHREIVESLPTTDIDPNTIYMILSGTSATENVYNEYMYVNNAWELIGTSATDLTNYYTKAEVDGKLLLKANASDLTSHTGDTTIHVTANDKSKWNTVALIKQLRLVNAQVGSATTIAFVNIDDTNGIKVGDKCMDLDGKLFEITAVDTTNQTVTVGSALIDLALNANVVHTSGNETITGTKTLDNVDLPFKNSAELGVSGGVTNITVSDKNGQQLCALKSIVYSSGAPVFQINLTQKVDNTIYTTNGIVVYQSPNSKVIQVRPTLSNDNADGLLVGLGSTSNRFYRIYGLTYYYGSDNVEFSTKFVTTDTNQTISGAKTFSSNVNVYNSDNTATTPNLYLRSSKIELSSQGNTSGDQNLTYLDKNNVIYAYVKGAIQSNGSVVKIRTIAKDSSDNSVINELQMLAYTNGNKAIFPLYSNEVDLGISSYKWKSFNGVEPSALSLPSGDASNFIDISSYFTNTGTGDTNSYTALANGWIYLRLGDLSSCQATIYDTNNNRLWGQSTTGSVEQITIPILKGQTLTTRWTTTSSVNVTNARFIPCIGNI